MSKPTDDDDSKDHYRWTTQPEHPLWVRLDELSVAFRDAAEDERSEDFYRVFLLLNALAHSQEFRNQAASLEDSWSSKLEDVPMRRDTRTGEEKDLRETLMLCIAEYEGAPWAVAQRLVLDLSTSPRFYARAPGAVHPRHFIGQPRDEVFYAAADLVEKRIALLLEVYPERRAIRAKRAEAIIKEAMRALRADPNYVKNMFRE